MRPARTLERLPCRVGASPLIPALESPALCARRTACHDLAMADRRARSVVLVHGAWIGPWCFAALQSELDRRGVPSFAVGLPGRLSG